MEDQSIMESNSDESSTKKTCSGCGRPFQKLKARGLCQTCYRKALKGDKDQSEAVTQITDGSNIVTIDFQPAPELLEGIAQRAIEQMHPLGNQIIWELKQAAK